MNKFNWNQHFNSKLGNLYPDEFVIRSTAKKFGIKSINLKNNRNKINVLDIGCGVGNNSMFFAQQGFNVFAYDSSTSAINILKKNLKFYKNFHARTLNFSEMNNYYNSNFFDLICDCTSLQHDEVNTYYDNLKVVFSKLKKNGIFIGKFLFKNKNMNPKNLFLNKISKFKLKNNLNYYSKNEIQISTISSENLINYSKYYLIYGEKK